MGDMPSKQILCILYICIKIFDSKSPTMGDMP